MKPSVLIKFEPLAGHKQALIDHLISTSNNLAEEEGTELFVVSTSPIEVDAVYVYEVYSSEEAKMLHESSGYYKIAREETNKLINGIPEVTPLFPMGGKGLK